MIKTAKKLVKEKNVKEISPTMFEVLGHSVVIKKKAGRTLLICNCFNDTKFCVESPICIHKICVLTYLINKDFIERLEKLIAEYQRYKELKLPVSLDCFINDLQDIKDKF